VQYYINVIFQDKKSSGYMMGIIPKERERFNYKMGETQGCSYMLLHRIEV